MLISLDAFINIADDFFAAYDLALGAREENSSFQSLTYKNRFVALRIIFDCRESFIDVLLCEPREQYIDWSCFLSEGKAVSLYVYAKKAEKEGMKYNLRATSGNILFLIFNKGERYYREICAEIDHYWKDFFLGEKDISEALKSNLPNHDS